MEPDRMSDEELVDYIREKDNQSYSVLVGRYAGKIERYALSILKDEDAAAEAAQDAFIKAYQNLMSFDARRKFSSWLYRIAHNECMDLLRRGKRVETMDDDFDVADDSDGPLESAMRSESAGHVRDCVNDLPVTYREPIYLFYMDGRSYEEISDILRLPIGTVGTRVARGRAALKKIYEKKYGKL